MEIKMTTNKAKKTPDEIQFTKPISEKEKKRGEALGRAMKYLRENGGAYIGAHLRGRSSF